MEPLSKTVTVCRACKGTKLKRWLDLGSQPIANNLLDSYVLDQFNLSGLDELYFPLELIYCLDCNLVQTSQVVDQDILFKDYLYHSSTSPIFREHFESLAKEEFNKDGVKPLDLVVDIGSNDGILLRPFKDLGARVLGVEPADDIAAKANANGIDTVNEYFTPDLANKIKEEHGEATLITATNVFAHIDDLDQVLDGVKLLLAPNGRFMIEVAYLPRMLEQGTFDLIYHEHLCYWHLRPLIALLNRKGFVVSKTWEINTHGGSIRVFAKIGRGLEINFNNIDDFDLIKTKEFLAFPTEIKKRKEEIIKLLSDLKKQKKSIIGYGAPAKMSTMTNYFEIGPETIDYIIEDATAKQSLYSPGKHIKIVPPIDFSNTRVDYIFIFAWNFSQSIIQECKKKGYKGKFIIPFPNLTIL